MDIYQIETSDGFVPHNNMPRPTHITNFTSNYLDGISILIEDNMFDILQLDATVII